MDTLLCCPPRSIHSHGVNRCQHGGVTTKLMPMLGDHLREVFAAEPANVDLLATIPIFLVDDGADVGLVGARVRARRELRHGAEGSAL